MITVTETQCTGSPKTGNFHSLSSIVKGKVQYNLCFPLSIHSTIHPSFQSCLSGRALAREIYTKLVEVWEQFMCDSFLS